MISWWWLIAAFYIGVAAGFALAALCTAAKQADAHTEAPAGGRSAMARAITITAATELDRLHREYCTCGGDSLNEAHHAPDCTYRSLMEKMADDLELELNQRRCGRRYIHA